MSDIQFTLRFTGSEPRLSVHLAGSETVVTTVPDLEEVVESLSREMTLRQHFALGKVAVLMMLLEDPELKVADVGKRLDAFYFPTARPEGNRTIAGRRASCF